ncbi:hypothetical protein Ahy_B10g105352 isoform B [Arachis hypogaea]|uniref:Uncharacterized protein n=1 Tax=Arachis hypogaea TaxID=3818 RepID=A0A444X880_ARAHY|nr:hypothetical protein Ahy_B10g105352 isoform B [Arachis hypogaea]
MKCCHYQFQENPFSKDILFQKMLVLTMKFHVVQIQSVIEVLLLQDTLFQKI